MTIKRILVPVDFSGCSDSALNHALYWAGQYDAKLTLVHVNSNFQEYVGYDELHYQLEEVQQNYDQRVQEWLDKKTAGGKQEKIVMRYEVLARSFC